MLSTTDLFGNLTHLQRLTLQTHRGANLSPLQFPDRGTGEMYFPPDQIALEEDPFRGAYGTDYLIVGGWVTPKLLKQGKTCCTSKPKSLAKVIGAVDLSLYWTQVGDQGFWLESTALDLDEQAQPAACQVPGLSDYHLWVRGASPWESYSDYATPLEQAAATLMLQWVKQLLLAQALRRGLQPDLVELALNGKASPSDLKTLASQWKPAAL